MSWSTDSVDGVDGGKLSRVDILKSNSRGNATFIGSVGTGRFVTGTAAGGRSRVGNVECKSFCDTEVKETPIFFASIDVHIGMRGEISTRQMF
jgi:hypothetical protein